MKRKGLLVVAVLFAVIIGLSLLLYPTVANYFNNVEYRQAIVDFQSTVEHIDEETYVDLLVTAREFNAKLLEKGPYMLVMDEDELAEYQSLLNFTGTGIMGYIEIPKINVYLPIYHGTSDAVLQSGVGHLEGSSLPTGGEGTHMVLSGHRGLPSATLFSDLDRLVEGDTFTVRILREVLTYEVDEITTVEPHESEVLLIEPELDICTLLTCTPYGVNTHRLLVRGHRIPTPEVVENDPAEPAQPGQAAPVMDSAWVFMPDTEAIAMLTVAVLLLLIVQAAALRRRRRARKANRAD